MNIGIDLLRYRPGCVGGGETYLLSYLNELAEREENRAAPTVAELADRYMREYAVRKAQSSRRDISWRTTST